MRWRPTSQRCGRAWAGPSRTPPRLGSWPAARTATWAIYSGEFREFRGEMRDFRDQNNRVLSAMRADVVDLRTHMDEGFASRGIPAIDEVRGDTRSARRSGGLEPETRRHAGASSSGDRATTRPTGPEEGLRTLVRWGDGLPDPPAPPAARHAGAAAARRRDHLRPRQLVLPMFVKEGADRAGADRVDARRRAAHPRLAAQGRRRRRDGGGRRAHALRRARPARRHRQRGRRPGRRAQRRAARRARRGRRRDRRHGRHLPRRVHRPRPLRRARRRRRGRQRRHARRLRARWPWRRPTRAPTCWARAG